MTLPENPTVEELRDELWQTALALKAREITPAEATRRAKAVGAILEGEGAQLRLVKLTGGRLEPGQ